MQSILNNTAAASTPQLITGSNSLLYRSATFFGCSGFNASGIPISNTSTVYFGVNSGQCVMSVAAGASSIYTVQTTQERDNLGNIWFQSATKGDGLYVLYN